MFKLIKPFVAALLVAGSAHAGTYALNGAGTETLTVDNDNRIILFDTFPPPNVVADFRKIERADHGRLVNTVRRSFIKQVCDIPKSRHAMLTWNYTAVNRIWDDSRTLIVEVYATRDDC